MNDFKCYWFGKYIRRYSLLNEYELIKIKLDMINQ